MLLTKDIFIKRCKEKHDNKYDYSLVDYVNTKTKVEIICKKHGEFLQTPEIHLKGGGCQKCAFIKVGRARSIKNNPSIQKERVKDFINKASKKHKNKYSYKKISFIPPSGSNEKVRINCKEHGEFLQNPFAHAKGAGCLECANKKKADLYKNKNFINDAIKIHGNKYDYSLVKYINNITKVKIICPEHGIFLQRPTQHTSKKSGCPKCKFKRISLSHIRKSISKYTQNDFLKDAIEIHGDKYDYAKIEYKSKSDFVGIVCKKHGEFNQRAHLHIKGHGCPTCAREKVAVHQRLGTQGFIKKAIEVHGNKYDYSETFYGNSQVDKIKVICSKHGDFYQLPSAHLRGQGCILCLYDRSRLTKKDFIDRASEIHNNKYDYSQFKLEKNIRAKVKIICSKHGVFNQTAGSHLMGTGCPKCVHKGEGRISEYLMKKHIIYIEYTIKNRRFDFMVPDLNLIIERDGEQHYGHKGYSKLIGQDPKEYTKKQQENDKYKAELAKDRGFKIARIPYWLSKEEEEIEIENILAGKPSYPDVPDLKQAKTKPKPVKNF